MTQTTVVSDWLAPEVLERLNDDVARLHENLLEREERVAYLLTRVRQDNLPSARNLVHYLALRGQDMRELQTRLAATGLSSLGRAEAHVLSSLDRVLAMLELARGAEVRKRPLPPVDFGHGERILAEHARRLLGSPRQNRDVRIMVTLPEEAARDSDLAHTLVGAGMDCARINCAHGNASDWSAMAAYVRSAAKALATDIRVVADIGGPKLRTGRVVGGDEHLELRAGDRFELWLANGRRPGGNAAVRAIECSAAELFRDARPRQAIWFNDGKIGGEIEEIHANRLLIHVTHVGPDGAKLRPDRGINLPDSNLDLPAFTEKDLTDLRDIVTWADGIELSFAQRESDVTALHDALREYGRPDLGIVLKIETPRAFERLPRLLLAALQGRTVGVMIARGDLAVESGFERLAEVQEEILWIAEAAHVPTIWATQVLENLTKKGNASRAEITDAAMSSRAECVMLNKGPYVVDAIRMLDDVLGRMRGHQSKKRSLLRALRVGADLW